jgi:hypothetical protein
MCVFTYTCSKKHNSFQIVSLCNKQHYVIYNNYMFRPCKWAIIRLFVEPVSWLCPGQTPTSQTPIVHLMCASVHHIWKWREVPTWCTNLFIISNNCTCFGHLYAHLQEYISCVLLHMVFSTRCCGWGPEESVCTVHRNPHRTLTTSATTPSAEQHMQQYTPYILLKLGI